jgi:hypothetical protein
MQSDFGSATVPVALAGVLPASDEALWRQLFGEAIKAAMVVGETPTTAVGTTAPPEPTESIRLCSFGNVPGAKKRCGPLRIRTPFHSQLGEFGV